MPKEIAWLPQEALDRMHSDLQAAGDITRAQLAERIVDDAAPLAAYELVSLMTNSEDDNIRLNAAKYLLDRVNGKPNTRVKLDVSQSNPVLQILDGVVVERPVPPDSRSQGLRGVTLPGDQPDFDPYPDLENP